MPLKLVVLPGELFDATERHCADFQILERDCFPVVAVGANAIDPDDVARHVIAGNLILAIFARQDRLARTGTYGIERRELLARTKQRLTFAQPDSPPDQ